MRPDLEMMRQVYSDERHILQICDHVERLEEALTQYARRDNWGHAGERTGKLQWFMGCRNGYEIAERVLGVER